MKKTDIVPNQKLDLKIYGYTLPRVETHDGCVKVGETSKDDVQHRIVEQTGTVGVEHELLFHRNAIRADGKLFHDRELHNYYRLRGIPRAVLNNQASEWFKFGDLSLAEKMADDFIRQDFDAVQTDGGDTDYILRAEQKRAVETTLSYMSNPVHGSEFLWNAKPRFGKTLTTYDLVRRIAGTNILIVTNRPSIANSWFDDFVKFIAWQEPGMKFVSETDALADRTPMTRDQYLSYAINSPEETNVRCVAFISLQDLKGAKFAGGDINKLKWVGDMDWDLLVIDEAHEGIDTQKTDRAFDKIKRNFTLHLSGTPFKAIASQKFRTEQIYNWSYLDEQKAKQEWDESSVDTNPYAALPTLNLFTYQMSKMVEQEVAQGMGMEDGTNLDYTFDLNEFFSTKEDGSFAYEADVVRFLDNLGEGKFPFAEGSHKNQLNHTFWLLPRVAAAKAMEMQLKKHPFFKDYAVVLAAGDGVSLQDDEDIDALETVATDEKRNKRSYNRVKDAIASNEKTITLSVTQLTTGVTIKEWTAVMMLSNIKSPALYFQAAFRAQNPYEFQDEATKEWFRKENAYVFDFAPDRTLILFDEFANNLSGDSVQSTTDHRQKNIKELINFFPVIAEDDEGTMREISPEDVLTIPSHIKATEVVKRGFMSNLLFANISAIFAAPAELKAILDKIPPEKDKRLTDKREVNVQDPMLNEKGEVEVDPIITINTTNGLFGQPIYRTDVEATLEKYSGITDRVTAAEKFAKDVVSQLQEGFAKTGEHFDLTKKLVAQDTKAAEKSLTTKVEENQYQREEKERLAKEAFDKQLEAADTPQAKEELTAQYEAERKTIEEAYVADVKKSIEEVTKAVVEAHLERREETKKRTTEDDVRDHLRGFTRTIPAFLMAYGDENTTLANFDLRIDPATFEELTSITLDEFRKLRDGFEYEEEGETKRVHGLFNEVVFNASIVEFFKLKERLADYLHNENDEDIFDYIPPQKTNQIFTPKRIVKMMVDILEAHDPDIFTKRDITFVDFYSKSGLYLTEVVKRLFLGLEDEIPDETERIAWILEKQVYACAPSNIIYNMVKNYVYAGFPMIKTTNLYELDMAEAAKQGKMAEVLKERIGKSVKFVLAIGNPPYQEETLGTSDNPIYHLFLSQAYKLADKACFITPARFLFNAGKTPKAWNREMLDDPHVKVELYEQDSTKIFGSSVDIKGGVCVTYRDSQETLGPIGAFTNSGELTGILQKVRSLGEPGLSTVIYEQNKFELEKLYASNPEYKGLLGSGGRERRLTTNIFSIIDLFTTQATKPDDVELLGIINNNRAIRFIGAQYVSNHENLRKFKVVLPKSTGSGALGEELSSPIVVGPGKGFTQSFISIGAFKTEAEAEAVLKYVKTKFARAMLGTLKVTQHNPAPTWANVPIQNFSASSDIDWSQSIADIDQQLYKKYGLTSEEIAFIESAIKPMA